MVMVEVMIRFLVVQSSQVRSAASDRRDDVEFVAGGKRLRCVFATRDELPVQRHRERRFCAESREGVGDGGGVG